MTVSRRLFNAEARLQDCPQEIHVLIAQFLPAKDLLRFKVLSTSIHSHVRGLYQIHTVVEAILKGRMTEEVYGRLSPFIRTVPLVFQLAFLKISPLLVMSGVSPSQRRAQKIRELFYAALQKQGESKDKDQQYLEEIGKNDKSLREELESLIVNYNRNDLNQKESMAPGAISLEIERKEKPLGFIDAVFHIDERTKNKALDEEETQRVFNCISPELKDDSSFIVYSMHKARLARYGALRLNCQNVFKKITQMAGEKVFLDPQVMLAALSMGAVIALDQADTSWTKSFEIMLPLAQKYPLAFQYASKELKDNDEFVQAVVSKYPFLLQKASERAQKQYILQYLQKNPLAHHIVRYASESVLIDMEFAKRVTQLSGEKAGYFFKDASSEQAAVTGRRSYNSNVKGVIWKL